MARIRTIKPEFFTSEDVVSLSPLARLLYIAMWCESDREGRFEWKPRTFKLRYLPGDNCDVEALATELTDSGMVVLYEVEGRVYAEIPSFTRHQSINNRENESVLPGRPNVPTSKASGGEADRIPTGVNVPAKLREEIILRDGGKCLRCGSVDSLTIDHIFPQCVGGTHARANLRTFCRSCNARRPTNGQELVDDLALDGLTMADMPRVCSDNSRVPTRASRVQAEGKEGREGKGREHASRDADPPADLLAGVDPKVAKDFRELRTRKKAPLTATAVEGIRREAVKAGVTLEQALRTCCERGWTGFRADWAGSSGSANGAAQAGGHDPNILPRLRA